MSGSIGAIAALVTAFHSAGLIGGRPPAAPSGPEEREDRRVLAPEVDELRAENAALRQRLDDLVRRNPGAVPRSQLAEVESLRAEIVEVRRRLEDLGREQRVAEDAREALDAEVLRGRRSADTRATRDALDRQVGTDHRLSELEARRRAQSEQLREIVDRYNRTAKGIIDSIGR